MADSSANLKQHGDPPSPTTPRGGRTRVEFQPPGEEQVVEIHVDSHPERGQYSRQHSRESRRSGRSSQLNLCRQPSALSTALDTFASVRSEAYDFEHNHPVHYDDQTLRRRRQSESSLQRMERELRQAEHEPLLSGSSAGMLDFRTYDATETDQSEQHTTDEHTPLLDETVHELVEPTGTAFHVVLQMMKCALGSGVISLPYAIQNCGLAASGVLLAFAAALNYWAMWMLLRCNERLSDKARAATGSPYSAIGYQVFGTAGIALIEIFILVTIFGASVAYLIFIEDTMSAVYPVIPRPGWVGISVIPLLGFVCMNDLSFLSYVSGVGLVGMVVGFASVFSYGYSASSFQIPGDMLVLRIQGAANMFSTVLFTYGYPILFFPVYQQMKKKSDADFLRVAAWSLVAVVATLLVIGTLALGAFSLVPGGVQQNIFANLPADSPVAIVVRASMSLVMLLSYPPTFFALGQVIQSYALAKTEPGLVRNLFNYGGRIFLVLLSGVIAILIPKIGDVIAVLGSLTINALSFILPAFAYLSIWGPDMGTVERFCVRLFFGASILVMIYTTEESVKTMIQHLAVA